jgi:hypothetical protein
MLRKPLVAGQQNAIFESEGCEVRRRTIRPVSRSLLQSFAPATHAKPSRLSAGNGPPGLWVGLYVVSRSRETEEKGQSPQRPPAVDTPLAVDCGSCVIPLPARMPAFVPEPFA